MIEKKKMFMVWTLEENASAPVVAIVEDGRVLGYYHEGENRLEEPMLCDRFFDTKQEANGYIRQRIADLKEKKKIVTDVLEEIYSYMDGYEENKESPIRLDDFVPFGVQRKYRKEGEADTRFVTDRLLRCVRTGRLEIGGTDVPLTSIAQIEWECDPVIYLAGGARIVVKGKKEGRLLKQIFLKD